MSQTRGPAAAGPGNPAPHGAPPALRGWAEALGTALAGLAAMAVTAALGLWAAGAAGLPGGGFPAVVAAAVVAAAGGSLTATGDAGFLARAGAAVDAVPLSVTLAGALVLAALFRRPLRHRAVAPPGELLGRMARTAVCWLVLLLLVALAARHRFTLSVGSGLADRIGAALGTTPTVGFRADLPATLGYGLLWVLAVLVLSFAVSRKAPLPPGLLRLPYAVRPPASAMLLVLLVYTALGLLAGLAELATGDHPARTLAVLLLGLPNLAWLALGIGTGGGWTGHVDRALGLPLPHPLEQVLGRAGQHTLDLGSLGAYDGRVWWLVAVAAVVLPAAAFAAAVRAPARTPAWRHALEMAVALALTLLVVGLATRIDAHYGLSLIGVGDLGGDLGGAVTLEPQSARLLGVGAGWGLVTGFAGALAARRVRHPGEVRDARRPPPAGR
ncbi:streptophobe family protein [Streptomyces sp. RS10V-4]|uniref:streptophobe family protein n=1 Tax=Streptomyces rhizoryzae TaxID=2932493 RepID=UPI00200644A6|nr:streptophobe family protein [Streptomyces rhizoryzae]MCK7625518.1 streptophobe family protein [Streptomyces rhizoryzae]